MRYIPDPVGPGRDPSSLEAANSGRFSKGIPIGGAVAILEMGRIHLLSREKRGPSNYNYISKWNQICSYMVPQICWPIPRYAKGTAPSKTIMTGPMTLELYLDMTWLLRRNTPAVLYSFYFNINSYHKQSESGLTSCVSCVADWILQLSSNFLELIIIHHNMT